MATLMVIGVYCCAVPGYDGDVLVSRQGLEAALQELSRPDVVPPPQSQELVRNPHLNNHSIKDNDEANHH